MLCLLFMSCFLLDGIFALHAFGPHMNTLHTFRGGRRRTQRTLKSLGADKAPAFPDKWIQQPLDHAHPGKETWKMRYSENLQFHKGTNLAFLMICGEWTMNQKWLVTDATFMSKEAKKHNAAMFITEHRYYGTSKPKPDLKLPNLKWLSSELALADLAHFIKQMNTEHKFKNPKWIVFGGSYAGSMAAWFRYKYPDLAFAAVSSSGPLHSKPDFPEYYRTVGEALSALNPKCVSAIKEANTIMEANIKKPEERKKYEQLFDLCEPLEDKGDDIPSFFSTLAGSFAGIVQGYDPGSEPPDMKMACDIMTNTKLGPVERYAEWSKKYAGKDCIQHKNSNWTAVLKDTTYCEDCTNRQWMYQTCTEFGWYQTSNKNDNIFSDEFNVNFFISWCTDAYSPTFNAAYVAKATAASNNKYKGLAIPIDKVIYVNGLFDPWSPLGLKQKPPKGSYVVLIKGVSHCADMFKPDKQDPPSLAKAQEKISQLLGMLINKQNNGTSSTESVFTF